MDEPKDEPTTELATKAQRPDRIQLRDASRVNDTQRQANKVMSLEEMCFVTDPKALVGVQVGQWCLEDLIGHGTMGAVYKSYSKQHGFAAVKIILPGVTGAMDYLPRFKLEASISKRLNHPAITRFYDFRHEPIPHLALQFVDGTTLGAFIAERHKIELSKALPILCDILSALIHAHESDVVHRDLKPDNILIDFSGRVFLSDFGIGRLNLKDEAPRLTQTGTVLGTPYYMSPEQIRGDKVISYQADFYAFGILAFRLLSGQHPFPGNQAEVLRAHMKREAPDIRSWLPDFPKELADLITRLLSKNARDRPENGAEILETLQKCSRDLRPDMEEAAAPTADPVLGDKVGEWRLVELLGVGGMGRVYLGELGLKKAAVKVLQSKSSSKDTALKRFEREIDILRNLTHPNIIGIIDSGVVEKNSLSYPYVVLEHCNLDLAYRVDQSGALSPKEVIDVGIALAQALSVAHVRGIIHRDVKPQNVLLKGEVINVSSVRLTDFGVARLHNSDQDLTRTRSAIGSPYYMAPEQAKEGDIDARADLYSLGATLYYLLTASYLYKGSDVERLIYAHAHELHEPAIVRNPSVPKGLSLIIDYLLLKNPNERVPDCETLIGDLKALSVGDLPKNRTQELQALVSAGRRPYEMRSNRFALFLTIALILVLGGFITLMVNRPEPFQNIRTTEANLREELASLPIDNTEKMRELLSEHRALKKSAKGIAESGHELPPDLIKKFEVFELQIGNRVLLRAERLLSISLETPLDTDKTAKLAIVETLLKSAQSLMLNGSDARRLKKLDSELGCFREAFPFLNSVTQVLDQYNKGAYLRCLPKYEKLLKDYDQFEERNSQNTKVLLALNDVVESLELSQSNCVKKIGDLRAQLALYKRRCQSAMKRKSQSQLNAVQGIVSKDFLESLPPGNEELEQGARKLLLIRLSLELDKAKQRLQALLQWREKNPGQFSYLLKQLRELDSDYPAKLYPEIAAQVSEIRAETIQTRNNTAETLFKTLVNDQKKRLQGLTLKIGDFEKFQSEVEAFPKNSQLAGWKDRERACREQVELIDRSKQNYASRLTKLARARFLERRKTTNSKAFLKQLDDVKQLLQSAAKFPNYEVKMGLRIQTQSRFLASLHHESIMQAFAKTELTIGQDDEGFPHNPAHKVKLKAFSIDRYETSVAQFAQFLSFLREISDARPEWCTVDEQLATPLQWSKQRTQPTLPVRGVTHDVAMIYCRYAGKQLPTEYQWECAIRFAGKNAGPYGWGKTWPDKRLACFKSLGPVAVKKAYSKTLGGVLHMNGNVAEWTLSRLKPYPGANEAVDLRGLNRSFYVVRGGSFGSEDIELALWRRESQDPRSKNMKTGFRCLVSDGD